MVDPGSEHTDEAADSFQTLDRRLAGSMPCIECGYELQGMSVRGHCPECGLAVRATILYIVDPHAEAFQPMRNPRLAGGALVIAALSGVIGALGVWILRLIDAASQGGAPPEWTRVVSFVPPSSALVAGLAMAVGLVNPVRGGPWWRPALASLATVLFAPLIWLLWRLHVVYDPQHFPPYFEVDAQPPRIALRVGIHATLLTILLLFRPTGRRLVARSLVLRTGRVDRQTLIATAGAIVLTTVGDLLRLASLHASPALGTLLGPVGTVVVAVGSVLITLGLLGAAIDCWRINRAISRPAPSLRQVLDGGGARGGRASDAPRTSGGSSPVTRTDPPPNA